MRTCKISALIMFPLLLAVPAAHASEVQTQAGGLINLNSGNSLGVGGEFRFQMPEISDSTSGRGTILIRREGQIRGTINDEKHDYLDARLRGLSLSGNGFSFTKIPARFGSVDLGSADLSTRRDLAVNSFQAGGSVGFLNYSVEGTRAILGHDVTAQLVLEPLKYLWGTSRVSGQRTDRHLQTYGARAATTLPKQLGRLEVSYVADRMRSKELASVARDTYGIELKQVRGSRTSVSLSDELTHVESRVDGRKGNARVEGRVNWAF